MPHPHNPNLLRIKQKISIKEVQILDHLSFLKFYDDNPKYLDKDILNQALKRYETYWIPFIHKTCPNYERDLEYLPPIDIHWVWHVHMLSPGCYHDDLCSSPLKRIINHQPVNPLSREAVDKRKKTAFQWELLFPGVPFDLDLDIKYEENHVSKFWYDIISASSRQKSFFYQVSLPHYQERNFLSSSIKRYVKFLYLKQRHPDSFLVPCYDIDIVWHTHQANTFKYWQDTVNLLGKLFNHDDSVNDRTAGSKLQNASEFTSSLWNAAYGESFMIPG